MPEKLLLKRLTIFFGLLAAAICLIGIVTAHFNITLFSSMNPNNRTIALSAAIMWTFLGFVLAYQAIKPLQRIARLFVQAVLVLIVVIETIEFIFSIQGSHSLTEILFVRAGTTILGSSSLPISPAAASLIILSAITLMIAIHYPGQLAKSTRVPDVISILGMLIALIGFTFVLSYIYGIPLLYETQYIPIAVLSAIAAFFIGTALIIVAGPGAVPVKYVIGNSTHARLLRVFVPLVIGIILIENIAFFEIPSEFKVVNPVLLSVTLVVFVLATAVVVAWISSRMGRALDQAEEELVRKNDDLNALNEELTSTQEELRQTNDDLLEHEQQLVQKNEELTAMDEELRQNLEELSLREQELVQSEANLREALAEKEILLSEIHHRVKNNLTAFISLLSLDGSYEDTEGGRALRKDLQNRARSMALIHETLYRTGKFSNVDMEIYLTTLVNQIAGTYAETGKIKTVVDVHGVTLDLARATTAGLIINELVTNSFKYAFPPGFDCAAARGNPCTIRVSLDLGNATYVLRVADNGRGLPEGFDPLATKSLGLKLVNFLARHQLRADIEVRSDQGTEFIFRLTDTEEY